MSSAFVAGVAARLGRAAAAAIEATVTVDAVREAPFANRLAEPGTERADDAAAGGVDRAGAATAAAGVLAPAPTVVHAPPTPTAVVAG
jgi:hypothetical protein